MAAKCAVTLRSNRQVLRFNSSCSQSELKSVDEDLELVSQGRFLEPIVLTEIFTGETLQLLQELLSPSLCARLPLQVSCNIRVKMSKQPYLLCKNFRLIVRQQVSVVFKALHFRGEFGPPLQTPLVKLVKNSVELGLSI